MGCALSTHDKGRPVVMVVKKDKQAAERSSKKKYAAGDPDDGKKANSTNHDQQQEHHPAVMMMNRGSISRFHRRLSLQLGRLAPSPRRRSILKVVVKTTGRKGDSQTIRRTSSMINEKGQLHNAQSQLQYALFERERTNFKVDETHSQIREKYHVSRTVLGRGTYGVVRKVRERETGQFYACKSLMKVKMSGKMSSVHREIKLLSVMTHKNIMQLKDVFIDNHFIHLVSPLYEGGDLYQRLLDNQGALEENEAALLMQDALDALAYCHEKGIAHRDIKPENLMFTGPGLGEGRLVLIDFGLGRQVDLEETLGGGGGGGGPSGGGGGPGPASAGQGGGGGDRALMHTVCGSPAYVAPEVLEGSHTMKCDIWSMGAVMYCMLAGYPPFFADSVQELFMVILDSETEVKFPSSEWSDISFEAQDLIRRLMAREPARRPAAEAALAHGWFAEAAGGARGAPGGVPSSTLTERYAGASFLRKRFAAALARDRLQRLAVGFIAEKLTEGEIGHLTRLFREMDTNGDGQVDLEELTEFLQQLQVRAERLGTVRNSDETDEDESRKSALTVLQRLDMDKNMKVNINEFVAAVVDRNVYIREANIRIAFERLAAEGQDRITAEDLRPYFDTLEHAEEVIRVYDLDGKGALVMADFKQMLIGMC